MNTGNIVNERFWEIDFVRGISILLMLALHLFDDIYFLNLFHYNLNWTLWFFWQRITASLFLLLVGVSLILSRLNAEKYGFGEKAGLFKKNFRRGLAIFGLGLMITVATKIYLQEGYIIFGVLHLIGAAVILSYPFLRLRLWNMFLGITAIAIGIYLNGISSSFSWLLWAGLAPAGFNSVDYFPVFPWFGLVLLGLSLGNILYSKEGRKFTLYDFSKFPVIKCLCYLGKKSLLIYLVHQPVFILLLTAAKFFSAKFC